MTNVNYYSNLSTPEPTDIKHVGGKVIRCINGCSNYAQFLVADKLTTLFKKGYKFFPDYDIVVTKIFCALQLKRIEIEYLNSTAPFEA